MFENYLNKKVIARSVSAGVFLGTLAEVSDDMKVVKLKDVRQLWYWSGAASLMQLANEGVARPDACRFTVTVDEVVISDVCEILPATEKCCKSIESVEEWKIRS